MKPICKLTNEEIDYLFECEQKGFTLDESIDHLKKNNYPKKRINEILKFYKKKNNSLKVFVIILLPLLIISLMGFGMAKGYIPNPLNIFGIGDGNSQDGLYRENGAVYLGVNSIKPLEILNTENNDYEYRLEGNDLIVIACSKDKKSKIKDLDLEVNEVEKTKKIKEFSQKDIEKGKDNSYCEKFSVENVKKNDKIKLGKHSTYLNITESEVTFGVTPEEKQCIGRACNSELVLINNDGSPISFYQSDLNVVFHNDFSNTKISYYYPNNITNYELICEGEEIEENCYYNYSNPVGSHFEDRLTSEDNYITMEAGEIKTFYLYSEAPEFGSEFKYDVEFYYGGEWWIIDPIYLTENSTFSGTYTNTTLNVTGNIILDGTNTSGYFEQDVYDAGSIQAWDNLNWNDGYGFEMPNNQETDYGINMTGNVLLLHFNNDSAYGENDTHVYDFSGTGNNGTVINGAFLNSSGKLNGAYQFDGYNDYILVPNTTVSSAYSFSFWIYPDSLPSSKGILGIGSNPIDNTPKILLASNNNCIRVYSQSGGFTSCYGVNLSKWHHISLVWNSSNVLKFYINNELKETKQCSNPSSKNDIYIGSGYLGSFDGVIDEVAMWNRSLSADEVSNVYKVGASHLNISVMSCDDASCAGETYETNGLTCAENEFQNCNISSLLDSRYIQYKANFLGNSIHTPSLWNVSVNYESGDSIQPIISLTNPSNESTIAESIYNFGFTATDETSTSLSCELFIGGVSFGTNTTVVNGTNTNITADLSSLGDGIHNWNINCSDEVLNTGTSTFWQFTLNARCPHFGIEWGSGEVFNVTCDGNTKTSGTYGFTNSEIPTCSATREGEIAYNFSSHKAIICNSTDWENIN